MPGYDVGDPIGRPLAQYEAVAGEVEALVDRLVSLAWPAMADEPRRAASRSTPTP